jgi:pimeloyl-ACP methyl ester carboxylesterase
MAVAENPGSAQRQLVASTHGQVEVLAEGSGPLVVMLPSAARGAGDLVEVASLIAARGFRVLRVEPRGSGLTEGPHLGIRLRELADDIARVVRAQKAGPAIVVGHAAGSFTARMTAVAHPSLVRGVVLAAAGAREVAPELKEAVLRVHDESLSAQERLRYLRLAFFSPSSDPSVWLDGWRPLIRFDNADAGDRDTWWGAGDKPVLELQGMDDPFKPASAAGEYRAAYGSRVQVVAIPRASHALFPEQPEAVAEAIVAWARTLPPAMPSPSP